MSLLIRITRGKCNWRATRGSRRISADTSGPPPRRWWIARPKMDCRGAWLRITSWRKVKKQCVLYNVHFSCFGWRLVIVWFLKWFDKCASDSRADIFGIWNQFDNWKLNRLLLRGYLTLENFPRSFYEFKSRVEKWMKIFFSETVDML